MLQNMIWAHVFYVGCQKVCILESHNTWKLFHSQGTKTHINFYKQSLTHTSRQIHIHRNTNSFYPCSPAAPRTFDTVAKTLTPVFSKEMETHHKLKSPISSRKDYLLKDFPGCGVYPTLADIM